MTEGTLNFAIGYGPIMAPPTTKARQSLGKLIDRLITGAIVPLADECTKYIGNEWYFQDCGVGQHPCWCVEAITDDAVYLVYPNGTVVSMAMDDYGTTHRVAI